MSQIRVHHQQGRSLSGRTTSEEVSSVLFQPSAGLSAAGSASGSFRRGRNEVSQPDRAR